MKKIVLILLVIFVFGSNGFAQEWFTSFDVAKRLALVQNKMLFVMWEDSFKTPYYVSITNENGEVIVIDLTENENLSKLIWDYFIPVLLPESDYGKFLNKAKKATTSLAYTDKLEDDSIKIMDVNGYILNTNFYIESVQNVTSLIKFYSLDTSYLNSYFRSYSKKENFTTTFILASKYLDFAIFSGNDTRFDIVDLATIYFKEAKNHLAESDLNNKSAFLQKLNLLEIKELLILNNANKAKRLLRRTKTSEIDNINESLYVFLNYTTFMLLKDKEAAALWKEKMSSVNLKKAELILKTNIPNWKPY